MLLTVLPEPSRDLGPLQLPLVVCRSSGSAVPPQRCFWWVCAPDSVAPCAALSQPKGTGLVRTHCITMAFKCIGFKDALWSRFSCLFSGFGSGLSSCSLMVQGYVCCSCSLISSSACVILPMGAVRAG